MSIAFVTPPWPIQRHHKDLPTHVDRQSSRLACSDAQHAADSRLDADAAGHPGLL
jgi:hypothetical protein